MSNAIAGGRVGIAGASIAGCAMAVAVGRLGCDRLFYPAGRLRMARWRVRLP